MSAYSTLVIDRHDEPDLDEQISEILCAETDRGNEADIELRGEGGDAKWCVQFATRYTVDGLENAAEQLSLVLDCHVEVVEEWDNRDADKQGREAYAYFRGVRVTEERALTVPAGVEVVAVPAATLAQWRADLKALLPAGTYAVLNEMRDYLPTP